jgi:uncharacterized protein
MWLLRTIASLALALSLTAPVLAQQQRPRILLFTRTEAFHHDSISDAVAAIQSLGATHAFDVATTEDPTLFADQTLGAYNAVVFLLSTGNLLNPEQRQAFQRYIESGHGYVGIHSASDTGYDWGWYGGLVGTYFANHPSIQPAVLHVEDPTHPSTARLPTTWQRTDEWYDFRTNPRDVPGIHILITLDESSYAGGLMGGDHPWSWYHAYDGGRAWYTAGGHTSESYQEPLFLQHLLGGIQYAAALPDDAGTWSRAAPMPTERAEVGAAAVNGKIYVVAAYSGATDANEAYDPSTDTWQELAPLPRGLNHVCAASVGDLLYVIGGFDPANGNRPVDSTYAYDPASNTWSARAPMPTPRGALACGSIGDQIYAIGGASPAGDTGTHEVYSTTSYTWQPDLAPMPTPREHVASAVLDGLIHVIGGRSPSLARTGSVHEVYDPAINAWSTAAPLPTGRSGIGAAVLNGRIHVFGGEADHTFEQNEAYTHATNAWQTFAPMPTARHGLGVVAIGQSIYVIAGGTRPGDSRSNTVEVFSLQ